MHPRSYCVEFIRGYDISGNEKLWIVTSGNVNSLALVDFNNDGKNEVNFHSIHHNSLSERVLFHRLFAAVIMEPLKSIKMTRCCRNSLKTPASSKSRELVYLVNFHTNR